MRMRLLPLAFFLLTATLACTPQATDPAPLGPAFFDLAGYMKQQIAELNRRQPAVIKAVTLDGKLETQAIQALDYAKELALFEQADINKPSWRQDYSVDSVLSQGALETIHYRALKDRLSTRELRIDFRSGAIQRIFVKEHMETVLARSDRELIYLPADGYQILSLQQNSGDSTVIDVRVNWVK